MSLNQVLRSAGGSFGSALGITLLTAHTAAGQPFPQDSGYSTAFLAGGLMCLAAAAITLLLLPNVRRAREDRTRLLAEESAAA
jgi:hypothetical protein